MTFALLAATAIIFCALWENILPARAVERALNRFHYRVNLSLAACNIVVIQIVRLAALYYTAQSLSLWQLFGWIDSPTVRLPVELFCLDLVIWIWHYCNHKIPYLWQFHKVHHTDAVLNTTSGIRFHPGEVFLHAFFQCGIIMLLGISVEVILLHELLVALFSIFHHSNVRIPYEEEVSHLLIVPSLHYMHHSIDEQQHDTNFGVVFSVWDRFFGTRLVGRPPAIGLRGAGVQGVRQAISFGFRSRNPEKERHS